MDFKKCSARWRAFEGRTLPGMRRPNPRRPNQIVLPLAAGVLAIAIVVVVIVVGGSSGGSSSGGSPSQALTAPTSSGFDGAALPPGRLAPAFTLTDQNGARVSLAALRGQVTVLTFLYSRCGAPCVVIAQQIRGALDELPRPVPVLIVSVDPRGDTPASVRRFLAQVSLSGRVHYLTGSAAQLRAVWRVYRIVPPRARGEAFARYVSVLLLDRRGQERVIFQSEQLTPEALSHDIGKLDGDPTHP